MILSVRPTCIKQDKESCYYIIGREHAGSGLHSYDMLSIRPAHTRPIFIKVYLNPRTKMFLQLSQTFIWGLWKKLLALIRISCPLTTPVHDICPGIPQLSPAHTECAQRPLCLTANWLPIGCLYMNKEFLILHLNLRPLLLFHVLSVEGFSQISQGRCSEGVRW